MDVFTTVRGIYVPCAATLKEGYEFALKDGGQFRVRANVSAEKLDGVFRAALRCLSDPVGLVFEAPCNRERELELRKSPSDRFHRDVYYLNGLDQQRALAIYSRFQELLIHDGFICFGAGAHQTGHEVFIGPYKVVYFSGRMPNPFETVLAEFGIPQTERLVTAWDTFTEAAPGQKSRERVRGVDIYSMVEELMRNNGLHFAKTIEC